MKSLIYTRLLAFAATAMFSSFLALPIHAEDAERIQRFFFHFLPLDASETWADWVAEGSERIVVQSRNAGPGTLMFGVPDYISWLPSDYEIRDTDGNVILNVAGTTWARASVVHITEDGVVKVDSVYWLIEEGEDPKVLNGLTAATGPEGDVATLENVTLRLASDGTFYIVRNNPSNPVRFSSGWFNK